MPTLRAVAGGARPVFRRECGPEGPGRSGEVVRGLPDSKGSSGRLEVGGAVPAPELLLIDAVAPLDFAVLLRASGPDVPMADPRECGIRVVPRVPDRLRRWALHRRVSLDASVASAAHCCGSAA